MDSVEVCFSSDLKNQKLSWVQELFFPSHFLQRHLKKFFIKKFSNPWTKPSSSESQQYNEIKKYFFFHHNPTCSFSHTGPDRSNKMSLRLYSTAQPDVKPLSPLRTLLSAFLKKHFTRIPWWIPFSYLRNLVQDWGQCPTLLIKKICDLKTFCIQAYMLEIICLYTKLIFFYKHYQ